MTHSNSSTLNDDFTTGENNSFGEVPTSRWRDGVQWHVLSFLGGTWCSPGLKYGPDWMANYVRMCNQVGGVVSIDVCLFRDATIEKSHLVFLAGMNRRLQERKNGKPTPPGNLATWKPTRLLNLDGTRKLPPSSDRIAAFGVDGNPETGAQAGSEYPWTYEVDLKEVQPVSRVVVTFGKETFATEFQVRISADQKHWQTVGGASDHDGSQYITRFEPANARYVRIVGRKPDGPGQRGGQMQVMELEVYK